MVKSALPADGRPMKKNDFILIAALLMAALAAFAGVSLYSKFSTSEPEAVVYQQGVTGKLQPDEGKVEWAKNVLFAIL